MRYLCVHCDKTFEHDDEGKKPRCPSCMRKHGIERLKETRKASDPPRRRWVMAAVAAAVVAGLVAAYMVWARETPDAVSGDVPIRPLERSELLGHARVLGADLGEMEAFLSADDDVEAFAENAAGSRSGGVEQAEAITEAIRARANVQAFVPWSMSTPREAPLHTAARTLSLMSEDGARLSLYPLEVAAVAVAALRSLDVPAMLAEVYAFPGDRTPPEPSGHFGYYVVAVYPGDPGEGTPRIFDPYGGRDSAPDEDELRVLTDVEALGAALNHTAIHQLVREGDQDRAFTLSTNALKLDRRGPAIRTVRGAVLIASGGAPEGVEELEAAAQIRPDPPRRNNMAGIHLAQGDLERAQREVAAALEMTRDYAAAHATMAAIHMARSEMSLAEQELETAQRLDRDLFTLPMLWANYYLSTGDMDRAVEQAQAAIAQRPHDWESRLKAAQVFRAAARYDDMRRQAHQVMDMVPASRREEVRQLIERILGPTALEEVPDEDLASAGGDGLDLPSPEFQLGQDSRLLGDEDDPGLPGGSLLGDEDLGGGDPLLNLGDPSTLRLREPGTDLRLDIGQE